MGSLLCMINISEAFVKSQSGILRVPRVKKIPKVNTKTFAVMMRVPPDTRGLVLEDLLVHYGCKSVEKLYIFFQL